MLTVHRARQAVRVSQSARVIACTAARSYASPSFKYQELFTSENPVDIPWMKLTDKYVSTEKIGDREFLKVEPEALQLLSATAMNHIAHLLRPAHLQQLSNILKDDEASQNDKFVALELLKNASIAAGEYVCC
ncbi:hypothetical protein SARC_05378 [Sphaeroforma arctica JP610]|uniref:Fe-S hydro-lyase tartrate dehydratase alpha-type catalytic domain-containing protein n=1 Tax=Sphaeroforma arctica JP610 TaxID=667725 RepID=A0A0L0G0F6_9EUKA|nr:hypothetical protein SARC_05378 [Sphaeroforma arctica JP610]KNC82339.1 hypothetical protein SARC_05378 [Sphaeroforma arctica JP610]|eukprot:XP_014156241.1 hypothetical protein SARC_05378 [Sphaeroforma arctica JP610]